MRDYLNRWLQYQQYCLVLERFCGERVTELEVKSSKFTVKERRKRPSVPGFPISLNFVRTEQEIVRIREESTPILRINLRTPRADLKGQRYTEECGEKGGEEQRKRAGRARPLQTLAAWGDIEAVER